MTLSSLLPLSIFGLYFTTDLLLKLHGTITSRRKYQWTSEPLKWSSSL